MLLGQHALDGARDAVVLAAGAGADEEFDIADRMPGRGVGCACAFGPSSAKMAIAKTAACAICM